MPNKEDWKHGQVLSQEFKVTIQRVEERVCLESKYQTISETGGKDGGQLRDYVPYLATETVDVEVLKVIVEEIDLARIIAAIYPKTSTVVAERKD